MIFFFLTPEVPDVYRYYLRNASRIDYDPVNRRINQQMMRRDSKMISKMRERYLQLGLNENGTMTKPTFLRELDGKKCECILTYFDDQRNPIEDGKNGNYLADGYIILLPGDESRSVLLSDFVVFEKGIGRGRQQYEALEEYIIGRYPEVEKIYGFCPFVKVRPFWEKMGFTFDKRDVVMGYNFKKL